MEAQALVRALDTQRELVERDLALGEWDRARRRTGYVLDPLSEYLRTIEPEAHEWMRLLILLSGVERGPNHTAQLSLWPELESPAAATGRSSRRAPGRDSWRAAGSPGDLCVITRDPQLLRLLALLEQLAPTDLPVLLEGESGTGKEIVARGIHRLSARSQQPFIAVNCGAIPGELHESELFGHTRGAYTGATMEKPGLFEAAHKGTLFLDEIGEMETRAQAKLLRVLESGELRRLGEVRTRSVDVRIIAATNQNVERSIESGTFRSDLLYRICALRASLPPLRERPGDILPLAVHFLRKSLSRPPALTPAARQALMSHHWPGNVRELKFVMERAAALWRHSGEALITRELLLLDRASESGREAIRDPSRPRGPLTDLVGGPAGDSAGDAAGDPAGDATGDFGDRGRSAESHDPQSPPRDDLLPDGWTVERYLLEIEKRLIANSLVRAGGNRSAAARSLGNMSRTTFIGKMKRFDLIETGREP